MRKWKSTSLKTEPITLRTIYAKTFCDNTYGDNTIGWGSTSHTFDKLRGSDKLELALYDANGSLALQFELDYIDDGGQGVSGYGTGGVTDGDGDMITGNAAYILDVKTSLSENFNTYGYVLLDDSPATDDNYTVNPNYPNWIYEIWYEVTIDLAAFGAAGWGYPEITDFHASPSREVCQMCDWCCPNQWHCPHTYCRRMSWRRSCEV